MKKTEDILKNSGYHPDNWDNSETLDDLYALMEEVVGEEELTEKGFLSMLTLEGYRTENGYLTSRGREMYGVYLDRSGLRKEQRNRLREVFGKKGKDGNNS